MGPWCSAQCGLLSGLQTPPEFPLKSVLSVAWPLGGWAFYICPSSQHNLADNMLLLVSAAARLVAITNGRNPSSDFSSFSFRFLVTMLK